MTVEVITLGCRLNFAESEMMRGFGSGDALTIVNSCAVTHEAVRRTRQAIRRARQARPAARIVVTGCAAQLDPAMFAAMPEVDRVVGNAEKYARSSFEGPFARRGCADNVQSVPDTWVGDVMTAPTPAVAAGFKSRVRSFVAIQTGCDHRCTFCTIWQARGPSRSLPYAAVRDAVEAELAAGAREIVLTGVDITSHEAGLGLLCQRLLREIPLLRRLRLSSLDSIEIDEALIDLVAGEPRLMPHFHLSLQAGNDLILKRMKRRHSRADAVATVARLKAARQDVTIGADLIAGFPTESATAAANSLALIDDCEIVAAHIFPFSPRPGTPAARMPQLPHDVVKARAAALREKAVGKRAAWLSSLVGTRHGVLVENKEKGHSDGFAPIHIVGAARGAVGQALFTDYDGHHLIGTFQ